MSTRLPSTSLVKVASRVTPRPWSPLPASTRSPGALAFDLGGRVVASEAQTDHPPMPQRTYLVLPLALPGQREVWLDVRAKDLDHALHPRHAQRRLGLVVPVHPGAIGALGHATVAPAAAAAAARAPLVRFRALRSRARARRARVARVLHRRAATLSRWQGVNRIGRAPRGHGGASRTKDRPARACSRRRASPSGGARAVGGRVAARALSAGGRRAAVAVGPLFVEPSFGTAEGRCQTRAG